MPTRAAGESSNKKKSKLAKFLQEYHGPLSTLFLGVAGLIATSIWQYRQSVTVRRGGEVRAGDRPHQGRQRLAHRARRDPVEEPERPVDAGAADGRPALRRAAVADARGDPRSGAGGVLRAGAGQGQPQLHARGAGGDRGEELQPARAGVQDDVHAALRRREGRRDLQGRRARRAVRRDRPGDPGRAGGGRRRRASRPRTARWRS